MLPREVDMVFKCIRFNTQYHNFQELIFSQKFLINTLNKSWQELQICTLSVKFAFSIYAQMQRNWVLGHQVRFQNL